jgi:hypothetical protein
MLHHAHFGTKGGNQTFAAFGSNICFPDDLVWLPRYFRQKDCAVSSDLIGSNLLKKSTADVSRGAALREILRVIVRSRDNELTVFDITLGNAPGPDHLAPVMARAIADSEVWR